MSICTIGYIKGKKTADDIFGVIKSVFDPNATIRRQNIDFYGEGGCENGFITFKYNNEDRELFYAYSPQHDPETEENFKRQGSDIAFAERTRIELNYWGHSVIIIENILGRLGGGWIVENDRECERPKKYNPAFSDDGYYNVYEIYPAIRDWKGVALVAAESAKDADQIIVEMIQKGFTQFEAVCVLESNKHSYLKSIKSGVILDETYYKPY